MPLRTIPQTPADFFLDKLAKLPSGTRFVVALDPERYLRLEDELIDPSGTTWCVLHYQNDDLAFRARLAQAGKAERRIIWVTRPELEAPEKVDLSFLADVLACAEDIVDLSLSGVLKRIEPRETWRAGTLALFAPIISANLPRFVDAYRDLRQIIGIGTPLGAHHFRMMTLAAMQKDVDVRDLLFDETDLDQVLRAYLRLAWTHEWSDDSRLLLRDLAKGSRADTIEIKAWLDADSRELALYVYLRVMAARYRVTNAANQLRGLQLLALDPNELEPKAGIAIALLGDKGVAVSVEQLAEQQLTSKNLVELAKTFVPGSLSDVRTALREETEPALVYALAARFLTSAEPKTLIPELRKWQSRSVVLSSGSKHFLELAQHAMQAVEKLAWIEQALAAGFDAPDDLSLLLDVYLKRQVFNLELAHARAKHALKALGIVGNLKAYLDDQHERVRLFLEKIDVKLAGLIAQDWGGFTNHPRLSINVLRDTVIKPLHGMSRKPRVWILVFDGMRWDTWQEVVRPVLSEHFQVESEKGYYCALPSFTDIARVSLLAGHLPSSWKDYRNEATGNHHILTARLLGLANSEREGKLQIVVSSETDVGQQKLDTSTKQYNVLIYNLSDDWIHHFRDDVRELNETIARKVVDGILPDLLSRVGEADLVVISSDHGFIELRERDQIQVKAQKDLNSYMEDDPRNPVVYRYLHGIEHEAGYKVQYRDDFYTLAKGQQWFQRERGRPTRYAHGGISMAEMVVPGVVLKRIVVPEVKFELELPRSVEAVEREETIVIARIRNLGNRVGRFIVTVTTNIGESIKIEDKLPAKTERPIEFRFTPRGKEQVVLNYQLTYRDTQNREQRISPQVLSVPVKLRKDVVELGGLDALDRLIEE